MLMYNGPLFHYFYAVPDLASRNPFKLISISFWLALVIRALPHFCPQQDVLDLILFQLEPWNELLLPFSREWLYKPGSGL